MPTQAPPQQDRYTICGRLASGGMATIHVGRLRGPMGFTRTVAIKVLHPTFSNQSEFVTMLLDEARMAARIRHPNAVAVLDVVVSNDVWLVLDYVHGVSLAELLKEAARRGEALPPPVVSAIVCGALQGLHAAHEARDDMGEPLHLVHRDVSPQNILVGADGVARLTDFGLAKAANRARVSKDDEVKGKIAYMAPEQLVSREASPRTDLFSAGVVLWEALTGSHLFEGDTVGAVLGGVLSAEIPPPSDVADVPPQVDAVVARATALSPQARFDSAAEMCAALELAIPPASSRDVASWVNRLASDTLAQRQALVAAAERSTAGGPVTSSPAAEPGPRSRAPLLALGALVALLAGALAMQAPRSPEPPAPGAPQTSPAPLPLPDPAAAALASAAPLAPSAAPLASSAAEPPPAAPPPAALAKPSPRPASARPAPGKPTRGAVDCSVPYFLDAQRVKVPRPECL